MNVRPLLCMITACLICSTAWPKDVLTLQSFLKQVKDQNLDLRAMQLQIKAFELRDDEGSLDFLTQLTGGVNYMDDQRQQAFPQFQGTRTLTYSGNIGVQKKFRTGTQASFVYNSAFSQVYNSTFVPQTGYWQDGPVISIVQPLWRDFNAALSKAREQTLQAQLRASSFQTQYSQQATLFTAESVYWQLVLLRQIVGFDKESIARTERIQKWNERRVKMNVADRADLLQAQATLQTKQLMYQGDLESLREISSQFNSLRNWKGDKVPEELMPLDSELEKDTEKLFEKRHERTDVVAAQYTAKNQTAAADAAIEQMRPDISLSGSVQFNGRDPDNGTAFGNSWNSNYPTYTAALKFSVPLDFGLLSDLKQGYRAGVEAAKNKATRALFDSDQDWDDLRKRFVDADTRLNLAKSLEQLQEEKLNHERERFRAGRTTSFQVLQFEENYTDAQLMRLRIESDLITLRAKARLYNGETL